MLTSFLLVIALLFNATALQVHGATTTSSRVVATPPVKIPAHKKNSTSAIVPNSLDFYSYCGGWTCCGSEARGTSYVLSLEDCAAACDNDSGCYVFTYDYLIGTCNIYPSYCGSGSSYSLEGSNYLYSYGSSSWCPTTESTSCGTTTTTDPCNPSPCQNGGTCYPSSSDPSAAVCYCTSDWEGPYCELPTTFQDMTECTNSRSCCEAPVSTTSLSYLYDCEVGGDL